MYISLVLLLLCPKGAVCASNKPLACGGGAYAEVLAQACEGAQSTQSWVESSTRVAIFLIRFAKGFVRMRHYGILASKNKATELNTAKAEFGLEAWIKSQVDWKTIAREKLNLNPDLCQKCKIGLLEIIEGIPPERGPPTFRLKPVLNFDKQ